MKALEVDIVHGHDLCSGVLVRNLISAIRRGEVLAVMSAPPCQTFTVARCSSDPMRSKLHPLGLPHLMNEKLAIVKRANTCVANLMRILRAAHACSVPWVVENPHSSFLWQAPSFVKMAAQDRVDTAVVDQCAFGARWRKRTRFLIGNVPSDEIASLQQLCRGQHGICGFSRKKHLVLQGKAPGNVNWTRIAQEFPPGLARRLARTLLAPARATELQV